MTIEIPRVPWPIILDLKQMRRDVDRLAREARKRADGPG